jgi:Xaa-Pro aminopeptidase
VGGLAGKRLTLKFLSGERTQAVSVEPPLFIPEEGIGVRFIDNVLVTASGGELLSPTPREIIVVG